MRAAASSNGSKSDAVSRAERFDFEGQAMTIAEIAAVVPALHGKTIRWHLKHGRGTREAMLCYYRRQAKPGRKSQLRIGRKIPHALGGPLPSTPEPIR